MFIVLRDKLPSIQNQFPELIAGRRGAAAGPRPGRGHPKCQGWGQRPTFTRKVEGELAFGSLRSFESDFAAVRAVPAACPTSASGSHANGVACLELEHKVLRHIFGLGGFKYEASHRFRVATTTAHSACNHDKNRRHSQQMDKARFDSHGQTIFQYCMSPNCFEATLVPLPFGVERSQHRLSLRSLPENPGRI